MRNNAVVKLSQERRELEPVTLTEMSVENESSGPDPRLRIKRPKTAVTHSKRSRYFANTTTDEIKDLLWLLAALVIIAGVHHFVPNTGAAPHSITNVVKSTGLFPG